MNFEQHYNDRAYDFMIRHHSQQIPINEFNRNCSPTNTNPFGQKQMQFNSWTNFTKDNNDGHVQFMKNTCGNKTPHQNNIIGRKSSAFCSVPSSFDE